MGEAMKFKGLQHGKCGNKCGIFLLAVRNGYCPICGKLLIRLTPNEEKIEAQYDEEIMKFCKDLHRRINILIKDFGDCSICGLCCKYEDVPLINNDIKKISSRLKIDFDEFINKYTGISKNNPVSKIIMNQPCMFLENNRCKIYKDSPLTCKYFPIYIIPGIPPYLEIRGIEWCSLSIHFFNALVEFNEMNCPDFFKAKNLGKIDEESLEDGSSIIKFIPIKYVYNFLLWLESKSEKEYIEKVEKLQISLDNKK